MCLWQVRSTAFKRISGKSGLIDQAIEKCINGLNPNAFTVLKFIPGIGPVWASDILAEIGDIATFNSSDALAKYAGLTWQKTIPATSFPKITQCSKPAMPTYVTT